MRLPFVVLIGVLVLVLTSRGRSGITMIELQGQQVEKSRRVNATLERIAAAMEKR